MATPKRFRSALRGAAVLLLCGPSLAQQQPEEQPSDEAVNPPYAGMYGSMGNVYHPYYRGTMPPGMGGMSGARALPGTERMGVPAYMDSPYSGMYGSMGNVYHPSYRY
jgi:hypothetical protein